MDGLRFKGLLGSIPVNRPMEGIIKGCVEWMIFTFKHKKKKKTQKNINPDLSAYKTIHIFLHSSIITPYLIFRLIKQKTKNNKTIQNGGHQQYEGHVTLKGKTFLIKALISRNNEKYM